MTNENQIVRLGLIGAGPWGRNYIRTIGGLGGVVLARLADANPKNHSHADTDCIVTGDWREVAGAGDLDGVIIATPPALHGEMAQAAVQAGNAALVEKPLTLDVGEARELLALAESVGGLVFTGHIHLYSAAWRAFKHEAANLGPVRAIDAAAGRWGPFREDVGVLWDWGPHDLSMCLDLLGHCPESVRAVVEETRKTPEGRGETLSVEAAFHDGVTANMTFSNLLNEKKRFFRATFDAGALVYDDLAPQKVIRYVSADARRGEAVPVDGGMALERLVKAFAKAIREGAHDMASLRLGVGVVECLARSQQALDNG